MHTAAENLHYEKEVMFPNVVFAPGTSREIEFNPPNNDLWRIVLAQKEARMPALLPQIYLNMDPFGNIKKDSTDKLIGFYHSHFCPVVRHDANHNDPLSNEHYLEGQYKGKTGTLYKWKSYPDGRLEVEHDDIQYSISMRWEQWYGDSVDFSVKGLFINSGLGGDITNCDMNNNGFSTLNIEGQKVSLTVMHQAWLKIAAASDLPIELVFLAGINGEYSSWRYRSFISFYDTLPDYIKNDRDVLSEIETLKMAMETEEEEEEEDSTTRSSLGRILIQGGIHIKDLTRIEDLFNEFFHKIFKDTRQEYRKKTVTDLVRFLLLHGDDGLARQMVRYTNQYLRFSNELVINDNALPRGGVIVDTIQPYPPLVQFIEDEEYYKRVASGRLKR